MQTTLNLDFVLIPEGEFTMGSDPSKDRHLQPDERPAHRLRVSDFHIMRHPVSNEQYFEFMQSTGHRAPLFWKEDRYPEGEGNYPVVGVSLQDAMAFCRWARVVTGKPVRLPTEAEWEKAARGEEGRIFPWGDQWEAGKCNSQEAKEGGTTPVGKFSPQGDSSYGVADLAGNVQDWTSSFFGKYPYDPADGREELVYDLDKEENMPRLYETGTTSVIHSLEAGQGKCVIRGGSWRESHDQSRCAYRSWAAPLHRSDDTGFRCVYEP